MYFCATVAIVYREREDGGEVTGRVCPPQSPVTPQRDISVSLRPPPRTRNIRRQEGDFYVL